MKIMKKIMAILLTLTLCVGMAQSMVLVKAGDTASFKEFTTGVNSDGTITVGKTISVSLSGIETVVPKGYNDRVIQGKASIHWDVSDSKGVTIKSIKATLKDGKYQIVVGANDVGKQYTLFVDDSENTNYQGETYTVKGLVAHILSGPSIGTIYTSQSFLKKDMTVNMLGYGSYTLGDDPQVYYAYTKIVKLYRNGKLVGTKTTDFASVTFKDVPVAFGNTDTFKVALFMKIKGMEVAGPTKTFKPQASSISKVKVYATKISKNKVVVRWTKANGVTGYYVYKGNKKVKTVSAKTNVVTVKKKKAGKAKYKVVPYVKSGKKIYKGKSNVAKPSKNQIKFKFSTSYKDYKYATCNFIVSKISLKGKTYTVTGYAANNRVFKMLKYKKLIVGLKVDGKKAFSKTLKNKKVNAKPSSSKKITFKVKGKAGRDLAHGVCSWTVGENPDWQYVKE